MKVQFVFIEGPETPAEYRDKVGTLTFPFEPHGDYLPVPGTEGTLMGIPGVFRENYQFEIKPVDLRDDVTKLLDQAAEILAVKAEPGDMIGHIQARHIRAQQLLLEAQLKILRRSR